jgi:hypothetical protein
MTTKTIEMTNSLTPISEKILMEKRRRYQTYMALDYVLSPTTYFDFFSLDAFKIVTYAKYLAQICQKQVTSDLLILPFFEYPSEVLTTLEELGINIEEMEIFISTLQETKKESFFEKQKSSLFSMWKEVKNFFVLETLSLDQEIEYSHEVNKILEKAAENALTRFKTPVISPEILFVTMLEEKNSKVSKIIRKFLTTDTAWYLLRYKLIKRIHYQESNIRGEILKNQHYFAYLLKTQLSDSEFNKLIEHEKLEEGVSKFRNRLVGQILKTNIFEEIAKEISTSIKISQKRSYSN